MASSAATHALVTERGQSCICEKLRHSPSFHADDCPKPGVRYCIPCGALIEGVLVMRGGVEIQPWGRHSDDCPERAATAA